MVFGEDTRWHVVLPVGGSLGSSLSGCRTLVALERIGPSQTLLDEKETFILFH